MKKNIEDMLKRAKRMIESMRVEDISSYFDVTMYSRRHGHGSLRWRKPAKKLRIYLKYT